MDLLARAKDRVSAKAYAEYRRNAMKLYQDSENQYLADYIHSIYAKYEEPTYTGGVSLDLKKVVEMINYLASNVSSLHKVKLMKMLWYSDALSFKRRGTSISGLAYCAWPMGAVPVGHDQIVLLDGVSYDEVRYEENIAYRFKPTPNYTIERLCREELEMMDVVIEWLGDLNTDEIVRKMHEEDAYTYTESNCIICYAHAENLSIQ